MPASLPGKRTCKRERGVQAYHGLKPCLVIGVAVRALCRVLPHSTMPSDDQSLVKMLPWRSMVSSAMPQPRTTQVRGSSATSTGRPVSSASRRSRSRSSAATGQHHAALGDVGAQLGRSLLQRVLHGRDDLVERIGQRFQHFVGRDGEAAGTPSERLRPLTSISLTSEPGKAEPICFLMASAVGSPISMP